MKVSKSLVAAGAALLSLSAAAFSLDDIHFWVGEGTNRCGVALDWKGSAKAWGYRWNGACTNLFEVMNRIVREDHRLDMGVQGMTSSYVDLYFFGYDVNDVACQWDRRNGAASDPDALTGLEDSVGYSQWWVLYGPIAGPAFPSSAQYSSWYSVTQLVPEDGQWFVFTIGSPDYDAQWNESPAVLTVPEAAQSPYGYRVVQYSSRAGVGYCEPENVLGRPTAYVYGQWGGPVSPYNPSWKDGALMTLDGEGDYVVIEFDHDVVDDPGNPFGIDFIVFGNAFGVGTTDDYYNEGNDPNHVFMDGTGAAEPGVVEVSQDGVRWYRFADGPFFDDMAPTLGFVYDEAAPDASLYSGNRWWGLPADACYPVDPSVDWSALAGLSLAEVCRRYNGSAGGTGYDLSRLDLPERDGRKWIRYVRLLPRYDEEEEEWTAPEVDAVADVSPVSGFRGWQLGNYGWADAWDASKSGASATAANGLPNMVDYLLGYGASDAAELSFAIGGFRKDADYCYIEVKTAMRLAPNCGLVVRRASDLAGAWTEELPEYLEPRVEGGVVVNVLRVPAGAGNSFFRLAVAE